MLRLDFGDDATLRVACTTMEVAATVGVTERQIRYWTKKSILTPSVRRGSGRGCVHLFGFDDIVEARIVADLRKRGCSLQKLRRAVGTLRVLLRDPNPLRYAVCAYDSGHLLAFYNTEAGQRACVEMLNAGSQQVLEIVVETLRADTARLLRKGG